MLGYDSRAARAAWSVFLVALLLATMYWIRSVLLVFVLAILFAYLLTPVVNGVDRVIARGRSRTYSLAAVYGLLVALLITGGILIGNKVAEEASSLITRFPAFEGTLRQKLSSPDPAWLVPAKHYLQTQIDERAQSFGAVALPVIQRISAHAVAVLSNVVFVVLIPLLSFFFLKDGRKLTNQALSFTSGPRRAMWEDIIADLNILLGQFMRALVILSLVTLTVYSTFFAIAGLPYPLLLASIAALLEFVPLIGPLLGAAIALLAAGLSGASHLLLILLFIVAYRVFTDYILSPHLMSSGIELHPLLVIFGALAGEELAGIPGMFLSVPVLAVLRVLYVRVRKAQIVPASSVVS
jgi:predicted PurR-regulated permease PerM